MGKNWDGQLETPVDINFFRRANYHVRRLANTWLAVTPAIAPGMRMEPTVNCTDSISKVTRAIGRRCNTALALRRRLNRLMREFASDFAIDRLAAVEIELMRQVATLTVAAESRAAAIVRGEHVDDDKLIRLSAEARRILTRLASALVRACARKPLSCLLRAIARYPTTNDRAASDRSRAI
jgi:hypothetical protein